MSMSTHVIGFKPPDEKWQQMKKVYDSCNAAGIDTPEDVEKFFNYDEPDDNGVEVELTLHEWGNNCQDGYEVHISEIPKDVKVIRFYNSY